MDTHPFDIFVGSRIKLARLNAGLSQSDLAAQVGLTFQQIQKYEKGANRTSCSRLYQISKVLDLPLAYFLEGFEGEHYSIDDEDKLEPVSTMIDSPDSVNLLRAFKSIDSLDARRSLLTVATVMSTGAKIDIMPS